MESWWRPATSPTGSATPSPGGRSRTQSSGSARWRGRSARFASRPTATACERCRSGRQLDGLVATGGDGTPTGAALIWMDRRAGTSVTRSATRFGRERLRELTGCNLDPGHVAAKISWLRRHRGEEHAAARWFLLPGSFVAWRAAGELAVDPSNASSTMLLDLETQGWCEEACSRFEVEPERLAPIRPAHDVLGPVAPWLRDAAGLDPSTLIVLGCGDEMAATLGAGVVSPGSVCDVMGTAEPVCAVVSEAGSRSQVHHRGPPPRHAGRLAAREPGLAVGRRLPLVSRRARLGRDGPRQRHRRRRVRASRT